MLEYLVYAISGRIILFVVQKAFPSYLKFIDNKKWKDFLEGLFGCDLCLGVWIYIPLAFAFNMNMLYEIFRIPVLYQIITGILTSFIVWIFRNGWDSQFKEYHIS